MSKLIYSLTWEPLLTPSITPSSLIWKNSHVNLKPLTIPAKRPIIDVALGPECASAVEYNVVLKIQREISPWQQVKIASF